MIISATDFGIVPGNDISVKLTELFVRLSRTDEPKELLIPPGVYYLTAESCAFDTLFITNTVGDGEFSGDERPHEAHIGLLLKNIKNLTVNAEGAIFVLDGKMTNAAIINCESVELNGLEIRHKNPDEHEFTVLKKTPFSVDFRLDGDSCYEADEKGFRFTGRDYEESFFRFKNASWGWFGKIFADDINHIRREKNPFFGALGIKEVEPYVFRVKYARTSRFTPGERYCVFNTRRQHVGIFIDKSKNIKLKGVSQRFNYSLALVAQDSEDITVDGVNFSPAAGQEKQLVSLADFMQFCMCRGKITVENSYFCGAGDDCLNVHGIHFSIVENRGNEIKVRFMHAQTHGFNPLRAGDTVEFVEPKTLLPDGSATILSSVLLNETDIMLTLDDGSRAEAGMVIEDVSACPELDFKNNTLTRIITRGLLITTQGNATVEGNSFDNTEMAAILFSDDAKNWYESGRCTQVTVKNNRFGSCGAYNIQILPENGATGSIVHGSFVIENNVFEKAVRGGIDANCAKSLTFMNNTGAGISPKFVKCRNISEFIEDK